MIGYKHVVEILHTGCANAREAEATARQLASERADLAVVSTRVNDADQAIATGYRGSPTVLVDGEDIEADPSTPIGSMG